MSPYEDRKVDFLLSVFEESNEHIRATDEKNILIASSFVALIAVMMAILMDKISIISWTYFVFSLFIIIIGFCILMLQLWYREWKEHYLDICREITLNFNLEDKLLPFWLRKTSINTVFSADKFLLLITFLINISIISYSLYLLWNLMKYSLSLKILILIFSLILYFSLIIVTKQKLINKQKFLLA